MNRTYPPGPLSSDVAGPDDLVEIACEASGMTAMHQFLFSEDVSGLVLADGRVHAVIRVDRPDREAIIERVHQRVGRRPRPRPLTPATEGK